MSSPRRSGPLKQAQIRGSALLFAALGDETRLLIVVRLSARAPRSIAALTAGTGVTRQAVTKHLRVLSDAGLIRDRRMGRERVWDLEPEKLEAARRALDRISAQWDSAFGRLRKLVET